MRFGASAEDAVRVELHPVELLRLAGWIQFSVTALGAPDECDAAQFLMWSRRRDTARRFAERLLAAYDSAKAGLHWVPAWSERTPDRGPCDPLMTACGMELVGHCATSDRDFSADLVGRCPKCIAAFRAHETTNTGQGNDPRP